MLSESHQLRIALSELWITSNGGLGTYIFNANVPGGGDGGWIGVRECLEN